MCVIDGIQSLRPFSYFGFVTKLANFLVFTEFIWRSNIYKGFPIDVELGLMF
jgi:hypothetical protein